MARFNFPIPGRSKKQPQVTVPEEPLSKAHKILGSTNISIDGNHTWEDTSNSNFSVQVSESTAPTTQSSGKSRHPGPRRKQAEWEDESDVVPHHLRVGDELDDLDDLGSDYSGVLRGQPSSSTIRSWYDKTKQPLAISQQTSSSAMAKGMPNKAQRLLDMDNALAAGSAKKKKPAMLDLSHLKPGSRTGRREEWKAPVLGNDYVDRSPSIMSPGFTPPDGKRDRRKIRKRPTKESLRLEASPRPGTSQSGRQQGGAQSDELPSLYRHYEQMSFAQFMDDETALTSGDAPAASSPSDPQGAFVRPEHARHYRPQGQKHREEGMPEPGHGYTSQTVLAPPPFKFEQSSPTDCSGSISSRHTRTSRASRHTEKSFQVTDLQETSVLMLSSDSEGDEDIDTHTDLPMIKGAPTALTRYSQSSSVSTISADYRPVELEGTLPALNYSQTSHLSISDGSSMRTMTTHSTMPTKRQSSAPYGFLTMQTGLASKTASEATASLRSRDSSQWGATFHFPASPSSSSPSTSSASTAITRRNRLANPVQESPLVTMIPAHSSDRGSDREGADSDLEYEEPDRVIRPESGVIVPTHAPTPPLSPSSVDFYIQSVHTSIDNIDSHEHVMGVTHQEQMLITALRQKRELMRKASVSSDDGSRIDRLAQRGHQAKASEVTITEATLKFGFPVPPTLKPELSNTTVSNALGLPMPGDEEFGKAVAQKASTSDGTIFVLSPPPTNHHKHSRSSLMDSGHREMSGYDSEKGHVLMYFDPSSPRGLAGEEVEPIYELKSSEVSQDVTPRTATQEAKKYPRPRPANRRNPPAVDTAQSKSHQEYFPSIDNVTTTEAPSARTKEPASDEADIQPASPTSTTSPTSPMGLDDFPAVPWSRRQSNNQARLSAVGPARLGAESGWWGDDDD